MSAVTAEESFERTLKVAGPATLEVNIESGRARISAGAKDAISIRGILRARRTLLGWGGSEDRMRRLAANPPVAQEGSVIRVGPEGELHDVTLLLDIEVPPDTRVHARTDSGDIHVEGIAAAVACESDSGAIEIGNIDGGVRASADCGGIRIGRVRGAVFAETDSGTIDVPEVAGAVDARADSGGVDVRLAPEAGYNIRVHTDSGAVALPELTFQRMRSRHETEGQVRGGGPLVEIETDSGAIFIS